MGPNFHFAAIRPHKADSTVYTAANYKTTGGSNDSGTPSKQLVKAGEEVKFIAGKGINIAQQGKDFTISNTMQITSKDGSITAKQDSKGNWDLSAPATNITFYTEKNGVNPANPNETAKSVKVGDKVYNLGDTVTGGGGTTEVEGLGSVRVTGDTSKYTVSIPVVASSNGASATPATVDSSTTNSLAIGEKAQVGADGADNVVIGNNSKVEDGGEGVTVIGNGITVSGGTGSKNAVVIGTGSAAGSVNASAVRAGGETNNAAGSQFTFRTRSDNGENNGGVNDAKNDNVATFNVGSDNGIKRQIKNVAAGQVGKGSYDAVNGDQLYSVAVAVANTGNSLAGKDSSGKNIGVLGESFTVNTDDSYGEIGTITGNNVAGTGADNLEEAIKLSRTKVAAGQGVKVTPVEKEGATTYTVKGLTVSGSTPATGGGNATATQLKGADGTVYDLAAGDENWNLTVNGNNQTTAGGKRNLKDTKNIKVSQTGEDISFDLANKVSIGGNQTGNSPIVIDGSGAKGTNKITGLAPNYTKQSGQIQAPKDAGGTNDQAATLGDVRNVGWNLKVNNQAKDFVNHGDNVNFKNGKGTTVTVTQSGTQSNIQVDIKSAKDLTIDTANPTKMGRVTANPNTDDGILTSSQVAKAINLAYWNVGTGTAVSGSDAKIHAGDRVGLVSGKGVKVTQSGNNFTFDSNLKEGNQIKITNNADGSQTIAYTGKDANTVTGVTVNNGQDAATNAKDGGNLKLTEDKTDPANPTYDISLNDEIDLTDKGSLKVGGDDVANGSPVTNVTAGNIDFGDTQGSITNVKGHLEDQVAGDTVIKDANKPDATAIQNAKNEAATVGDVLNAGWNLKVGDKDADFVQHGDTVAFGNGKGTTAQFAKDDTTGETTISFDIAKANNPIIPAVGKPNAGTVTGGTANQYWDSVQVQDAINGAGWFVNSGAVKGKGTNRGAAKTLVKAGDEVKFIAGDGMNIVQKGKEFTFNAKIVDANGNALKLDDKGNYVVNGGTGGSGKPFTVTANDNNGKPSTTTINGAKGEGSGVTFKGDENVKVIKQPTKGGDGTDVAVGLQDVVTVGGTQNDVNGGTPNKGAVTIDGTKGGNSIAISTDGKGNLKVGNSNKNNAAPIKITNVKAGANGTQDAVNVAQVEDVVGAANRNTKGSVSTKGSDGKEYTLKTYNVNGQTEYLTNNVVEAVSKMNEQGIKFFHVNDGTQKPVAQAKNKVDSQAFGKNAVAIGVGSIAEGEDSIAIGTRNKVSGKGSGAIGDPNEVSGSGSYVLGNNNKVTTNNTFVLGSNVTNTAANSVFLGDSSSQATKGAGATGTVSNAKVGDITYSGFAGETSVGMVSVGNASEVRRVSGVAAGEISATSTDAINGSQLYSALSNSGVYVTGNGAAPTDANLVKLGDKAGALNFVDGKGTTARVTGNTVTFDTVPGYAEGIKAGENVSFAYEDNTDADGNPLYVTTTGGTTTDPNAADVKVDAKGVPVKQQTTVISANLKPLQDQVQHVENNAYAGVAQAMATAGLPQAYLPGKSMLAVSGGHYKGETGYALGLSSISDSGNWVFKATASGNSRGNVGGTIGAGYQW